MDSDRSLVLPQAFLDRMKDMLQDDYDAFLQAYDQPRTYGLRVNTAKISCSSYMFCRSSSSFPYHFSFFCAPW